MLRKLLVLLTIPLLTVVFTSISYADGYVVGTKIKAHTIDVNDLAPGGFKVAYVFTSNDIAANLSAAEMPIAISAGTTEFIHYYTMPFAGSVIGVSIYSDDAITAPYLTADVTINGTATGLQAALDTTNTQTHYNSQNYTADTFSVGNRLGVKISTDSGFTPTTADISVVVIVGQ